MTEPGTSTEDNAGTTEATGTDAPAEEATGTAAPAADGASAEDAAPKKKRTKSTARKTRTVELTLTVTGTAEGEWQADLMHSGKRVVQGLSVPAAAVAKAAAELHPEISETIDTVITQAREQHEAKLAELEAEVERVRKALAELEN
ncbi:DUF6319 family protein [Saccharopolyspora cebuensis]|uniref:DUF6319 family protein n=1 Tax=Saccharopolyspora cebuensis TaxID=418759 RepID=A0ABV4CLN2_9PSEU